MRTIKREMKAALKEYPPERLQAITLTATEYQQAKNDEDEIEWQGFMYDVARVERHGSHVMIYALRDEAETNLLAFLNNVIELAKQDHETAPPVFTSFYFLPVILPSAVWLSTERMVTKLNHETPYVALPCDGYSDRVIQPPRS
jgi:hypothetical protein